MASSFCSLPRGSRESDFQVEIKGVSLKTNFACDKLSFERPQPDGPSYLSRKNNFLDERFPVGNNADSNLIAQRRDSKCPEILQTRQNERSTPNVLINQPLKGIKAKLHCKLSCKIAPDLLNAPYTDSSKQLLIPYWKNCTSNSTEASSKELLVFTLQSKDAIFQNPKMSAMYFTSHKTQSVRREQTPQYIHTIDGNVVAVTKLLPIEGASLATVTSHKPDRKRSKGRPQQLERLDLPPVQFHPHKFHDAFKENDASFFGMPTSNDRPSPGNNSKFRPLTIDTGIIQDDEYIIGKACGESYYDVCPWTSEQSDAQIPGIGKCLAINATKTFEEKKSPGTQEIFDLKNSMGISGFLDLEINEINPFTDTQKESADEHQERIHFSGENSVHINTDVSVPDENKFGIQTPECKRDIKCDEEYEGIHDVCTQGICCEECPWNIQNSNNAVTETKSERQQSVETIFDSVVSLDDDCVEKHVEQFESNTGNSFPTQSKFKRIDRKETLQFVSSISTDKWSQSTQNLRLNRYGNDNLAKLPSQQLQKKARVIPDSLKKNMEDTMAVSRRQSYERKERKKEIIKNVKDTPKNSIGIKQPRFPAISAHKITKSKSIIETRRLSKVCTFQDKNLYKMKTPKASASEKILAHTTDGMTMQLTADSVKSWSKCLRNTYQATGKQEDTLSFNDDQREPIQTERYIWLPQNKDLPPLAREGCSMFYAIKLPEDNKKPQPKRNTKRRVPQLSERLLKLPSRWRSVAAENKAKVEATVRKRSFEENYLKASRSNNGDPADSLSYSDEDVVPLTMQSWHKGSSSNATDVKPTISRAPQLSASRISVAESSGFLVQKCQDLSDTVGSASSGTQIENLLLMTESRVPPMPTMSISSTSTVSIHTSFSSTGKDRKNNKTTPHTTNHSKTTNHVGKEFENNYEEEKAFEDIKPKTMMSSYYFDEIENNYRPIDSHMQSSVGQNIEGNELNLGGHLMDHFKDIIKDQQDETDQPDTSWSYVKCEPPDVAFSDRDCEDKTTWSLKSPKSSNQAQVAHNNSKNMILSYDEMSQAICQADQPKQNQEQSNRDLTLSACSPCDLFNLSFYNQLCYSGKGVIQATAVREKGSTVTWKKFPIRDATNHNLFATQSFLPMLSSFDVLVTGCALLDKWCVSTSSLLAAVPRQNVFDFPSRACHDILRQNPHAKRLLIENPTLNHKNWIQKRFYLSEKSTDKSSPKAIMADQLFLHGHGISTFLAKRNELVPKTSLTSLKFQPIRHQTNMTSNYPRQPFRCQSNVNVTTGLALCKSCMYASTGYVDR